MMCLEKKIKLLSCYWGCRGLNLQPSDKQSNAFANWASSTPRFIADLILFSIFTVYKNMTDKAG